MSVEKIQDTDVAFNKAELLFPDSGLHSVKTYHVSFHSHWKEYRHFKQTQLLQGLIDCQILKKCVFFTNSSAGWTRSVSVSETNEESDAFRAL